jgi:hypothetical protein
MSSNLNFAGDNWQICDNRIPYGSDIAVRFLIEWIKHAPADNHLSPVHFSGNIVEDHSMTVSRANLHSAQPS